MKLRFLSSLQEISPLAHSFVGGYLLNPYLTPFREALNLAASEIQQQIQAKDQSRPSLQRSASAISSVWRRQPDFPYKLIEARNVGMTAIMLFARKPDAIHHIQFAECAFGIANMGNKGAVALRVTYSDAGAAAAAAADKGKGKSGEQLAEGSSSTSTVGTAAERRTTELTFVATHLAAMEYNLRRRNANWATIVVSTACFKCLSLLPTIPHFLPEGTTTICTRSHFVFLHVHMEGDLCMIGHGCAHYDYLNRFFPSHHHSSHSSFHSLPRAYDQHAILTKFVVFLHVRESENDSA